MARLRPTCATLSVCVRRLWNSWVSLGSTTWVTAARRRNALEYRIRSLSRIASDLKSPLPACLSMNRESRNLISSAEALSIGQSDFVTFA